MTSRSPTSSAVAGPASDMEAPSSPPPLDGKSFVSHAVTEDEDTRMIDETPEPVEKTSRGKAKSQKDKDQGSQSTIGKIRHLKKEDGEPLWRKDIQYDFLKAIFDDETLVFTNSYEPDRPPQNFADLYIDAMSRSSKTSKVLRDKLLSDRDAAKGMAMVCLLVNIGRMNTTLNFFPEMRAQLRTYHAVPSLQVHQDPSMQNHQDPHDPHAYKQLQDAPRLKSILKGGVEDRAEPSSLNKIKARDVPRTNPLNLLFVICNAAVKVAELHFPPNQEFHDLVMKTNMTSKSRARAFLWIMWFYLESDFTEEGCDENPFGSGVDYGVGVANQGVPELEEMTAEEEEAENIDSPEEIEFGGEMQKKRAKILEAEQQLTDLALGKKAGPRASRLVAEEGPAILPRIRPSRNESDVDSTRSTPPPKARAIERAKGSSRRGGGSLKYQIFEGSSPGGPGQTPSGGGRGGAEGGSGGGQQQVIDGIVARKPRPLTAHQQAVEKNRSQRVHHILDRGIRKERRRARKLRKQEGGIYRAWKRLQAMPGDAWLEDSDPESEMLALADYGLKESSGIFRDKGMGGLSTLKTDKDEFGEEAAAYAGAVRRVARRLDRWAPYKGTDRGVVAPVKKFTASAAATNGADAEGDGDGEGYGDDEAGDQTLLDQDTFEAYDQGTPVPKPKRKRKTKVTVRAKVNGEANGDVEAAADEAEAEAEDADKTALGGNSGGEEEELDDMERSLLGMPPGDDAEDSGVESE